MKHKSSAFALLLFICCAELAAGAPPPIATLDVLPDSTLPGLPVAFVVTLTNPASTVQRVTETLRLQVQTRDTTFFAHGIVPTETQLGMPREQTTDCHSLRCVTLQPHEQRQVYIDFPENGFFFDERLNAIGTFTLELRLVVATESGTVEIRTNPAKLTIRQPIGADAQVWALMQQTSDGSAWDLRRWLMGEQIEAIRRQFSSSGYAPWTVAFAHAGEPTASLKLFDDALATKPTGALRDNLLWQKAISLQKWSRSALVYDRDVEKAVALSEKARQTLQTLRDMASSAVMRKRAESALTQVITRDAANAELQNLSALDPAAPGHVIPNVNCVFKGANGSFAAAFGYANNNSVMKVIPIGTRNRFGPGQADRGLPSAFRSGVWRMVVTAPAESGEISWFLDGSVATARSSFAAECALLQVRPLGACVKAEGDDDSDGSVKVYMGYDNPNPVPLTIGIGPRNRFSPGGTDRGQPTSFQPGQHENAFKTRVRRTETVTWMLDGASLTVTPSALDKCKSKGLD